MTKAQKKFFKLLPQAVGMVIATYKGTEFEHKLFDNEFLVSKATDLTRRFISAEKRQPEGTGQGVIN